MALQESFPQATLAFRRLLGAAYDPNWAYQLIFPTSYPVKHRDGWTLVHEEADSILGQTLVLVGRPKEITSAY